MKANFDKRRVIGRKIVDVDLRPFQSDPRYPAERAHDVIFTLDNGAQISFVVEETEVGEYGICPCYRKPR